MVSIPYGKQTIDESDVREVIEILQSDWLTQGPKVQEFEKSLAGYCGARYAAVFSNGTAALQAAYFAAGLKGGDEIITSPITFSGTTNAALWQGIKPIFADIDPASANLDPVACKKAITPKTKALVPVDYAGLPADLDAFRSLADSNGIVLIEDACHALGAAYRGKKIGAWSDLTVFSFHPVKSITTGEGGAVLTQNEGFYKKLVRFRDHGMQRGEDWKYSVEELGINGRLTDLQCALGLSQLKRLDEFIERRREIARRYEEIFKSWPELELFPPAATADSSRHLFVLKLRGSLAAHRQEIFRSMRKRGIGVQVHYIPVYWHPLYEKLGYKKGLCPKAEDFYQRILSIPIYPSLTKAQQDQVIDTLRGVLDGICVAAPPDRGKRS